MLGLVLGSVLGPPRAGVIGDEGLQQRNRQLGAQAVQVDMGLCVAGTVCVLCNLCPGLSPPERAVCLFERRVVFITTA